MKTLMSLAFLLCCSSSFALSITVNPEKVGFWITHEAPIGDSFNFSAPVMPVKLNASLYDGNGNSIGIILVHQDGHDDVDSKVANTKSSCDAVQAEAKKPSVNKKIRIDTDINGLPSCSISGESRS